MSCCTKRVSHHQKTPQRQNNFCVQPRPLARLHFEAHFLILHRGVITLRPPRELEDLDPPSCEQLPALRPKLPNPVQDGGLCPFQHLLTAALHQLAICLQNLWYSIPGLQRPSESGSFVDFCFMDTGSVRASMLQLQRVTLALRRL